MAEAEFFVHEVEVIMQTLAVVRNQIRLASLLVVPGLVCRAGLHGGENTHQSRMLSSLCQYCFREIFFPNVPLADELGLYACLRRHLFGIFTNPVAERFGELRVVEDPDIPLVQKRGHPAREADPRQCPEY